MAVNGTAGSDFIHVAGDGLPIEPGHTEVLPGATNGADTITSGGGGDDIIHAGGGADTILFGADLDGNDQIDGGDGSDTLEISEQVTVTFGASSLTSIETIKIDSVPAQLGFLGFVGLTLNNANIAAGASMTIDASALPSSGNTAVEFSLNYANETDAASIKVLGGHGPNTIVGRDSTGVDNIDVSLSTSADVTAGGTIYFGANYNSFDRVHGLSDTWVQIEGNYAGGLTLSGTQLSHVYEVVIGPGFTHVDPGYDYHITTTDDLTPQFGGIFIDASSVQAGHSVYLDMSAETNGFMQVYGGKGDDTFIGGSGGSNAFYIYYGGNDHVIGGPGNDSITAYGTFNSSDVVDGGSGDDTLYLDGDYSVGLALTSTNLANVEKIILGGLFESAKHYILISNDTLLAANQLLTIDGSHIDAMHAFIFNGAGETDGRFNLIAGHGEDTLTGGLGADVFTFTPANLTGTDTVSGGGGAAIDTLQFTTAGTVAAGAFAAVLHIEKIVLANGSNNIALSDAMVGSADDSHVLSVMGGTGNDIVNAIGVTTTANRVFFTAGSGNDIVGGGAGADSFFFAPGELTAADIVNGGSGAAIDRILFTAAGTIAAATLQNVAQVEQFVLANGSNSLTLTDALVATADNHILYVLGSTGNDAVNAGALAFANRAYITGGAGNDTLTGGLGLDIFYFTATDLTAADTVNGGAGTSSDILAITTAGTIAAAAFANVSHVEQIVLTSGVNSLTLTDALVGSSDLGHVLTINGGTGDDVVDASAVTTAANKVYLIAAAGNDTLTGGAGADDFFFAAADLTAADTVNGGTGAAIDAIVLTSAGTVAAGAFANVSHVEAITLANGVNSIALSDALVGSADDSHLLTIYGNAGNDTINAAAVTTAANRVIVSSGAGADVLTGGAGADIFNFTAADLTAADTVNGGSGAVTDNLVFSTAGAIAAAAFANVSHIEQIVLANGVNSIALSDAMVGASDANHLVAVGGGTGNDTIDASGVTTSTNRVFFTGGDGADAMTAGAGADTFAYAVGSNSTGTAFDTITAMNFAADHFDTPGAAGTITLVEGLRNGAVNSGNFTADITTAFAGLAGHHAGLITAGNGTLMGQTYLVVDLNGAVGYQSGADLVIHMTGASGTLAAGNFV